MAFSKLITIALIASTLKPSADAACRVCNTNEIACVSKNEFQFCFNGVRNTSQTFVCPKATQICTKFGVVCIDTEEAVNVKPDCDERKVCGVCSDVVDGGFTCTSRSTFVMCSDGKLTKQSGRCPKDYLCDPRQNSAPCVKNCDVDVSTLCGEDTSVTTISTLPPSTTSIPTPTPKTKPPGFVCTTSGRFPLIDKSDCSGYFHCYWQAEFLTAVHLMCPRGTYFNEISTVCVREKPEWCA